MASMPGGEIIGCIQVSAQRVREYMIIYRAAREVRPERSDCGSQKPLRGDSRTCWLRLLVFCGISALERGVEHTDPWLGQ
jgi:hypothetical protein